MKSKEIIELKNIVRDYPQIQNTVPVRALDKINVSIPKGSFTCIVGESGCGKTSLLRLIAGLDRPTSGEILIDGKKIAGINDKCGMVFQENVLFPWLAVRENVAFGPKRIGHYKGNESSVEELLKTVRIEKFADSYPGQLSGGMQQRVALARALANKPEIMLLDEPLSALDAFTRMHLQDELLRLWNLHQNTVVMITHDIDEAVYLADNILVMTPHPGQIKTVMQNSMSYPRNRASDDFVLLRNQLLTCLNYANKQEETSNG